MNGEGGWVSFFSLESFHWLCRVTLEYYFLVSRLISIGGPHKLVMMQIVDLMGLQINDKKNMSSTAVTFCIHQCNRTGRVGR